jgi:hypothetical protein
MRSEQGFALIHLICFLPVLLAVGFALYLFLSFSDTHLELSQTCLKEQIKIQENIKRSLRELLKLNHPSAQLKAQYLAAQAQYLASTAAGNAPMAALALANIHTIQAQRQVLSLQQRALILAANQQTETDQQSLKHQLEAVGDRRHIGFKMFMGLEIQNLQYKPAPLAITPDAQDLAPTYSLSKNFSEDQALEFRWDLRTSSQKAAGFFLPMKNHFLQSCSTTINAKEAAWPTVTRQVKSLWKRSLSSPF